MSLFKWPFALLALLLATACARPGAPVTVLAAASDLDEGTPLERELVVEVQVPAGLATENTVRPEGLESLIGRPIRIPLRKGDLLLTSLLAPPEERLSPLVQKKGRAVSLSVSGAEGIHVGDRVDVLAVLKSPATGEWTTQTAVQNAVVLSVGPQSPQPDENQGFTLRRVTLHVLPEEAELLLLAGQIGALHLTARHRDDLEVQQERSLATAQTLLTGVRAQALEELRLRTLRKALGPRAPDLTAAAAPEPNAQAAAPAPPPPVPQLPSRDEP